MSTFRFTVNGREQKNWLSATFRRSIDELCAQFIFRTSFRPEYPIRRNDLIQVFVDDELKLTGYQDMLEGSRTATSKVRTIQGRDLTQDIVDSNVPPEAANLEGGTLRDMVEAVINALNMPIRVIEDLDKPLEPFETFGDFDIESSSMDQLAFSFLSSFARKRQVYLITNPDGDIVIFRPNDRSKLSLPLIVDTELKNRTIEEVIFKKNFTQDFSKITCGSQDILLYSDQFEDSASLLGTVEIPGIRESRQRQVISEEAIDSEECTARATEEANILKMQSEIYQCVLDGVTAPDGTQWEIGQQIQIIDNDFGVRGLFLLKSYTMSLDLQKGSRTVLTFVRPTSYQPFAEVPAFSKRKTKFEPEEVDYVSDGNN